MNDLYNHTTAGGRVVRGADEIDLVGVKGDCGGGGVQVEIPQQQNQEFSRN